MPRLLPTTNLRWKMDKKLDEELHLVHVGLSRVAEESITALQETAENVRGNGETIDFDEARDLAGEVVACADAADRVMEMYKTEDRKRLKASERAKASVPAGKVNDGKEVKGNGKRRS